jgi:hypothetical protein
MAQKRRWHRHILRFRAKWESAAAGHRFDSCFATRRAESAAISHQVRRHRQTNLRAPAATHSPGNPSEVRIEWALPADSRIFPDDPA